MRKSERPESGPTPSTASRTGPSSDVSEWGKLTSPPLSSEASRKRLFVTPRPQSKPTKTPTQQQTYNGAEILVEALVHQGVECIFAYPGGASMPLHQALLKFKDQIRTILPRHEQGGGFAAQGLARSTGKVGVVHGDQRPRSRRTS